MASFRQATSHYLSKCWPRSMVSLGHSELIINVIIFKRILVIDSWGSSCEIALMWMSLDLTDDPSTLVQVMAWCCQATSHYLSQCWPRSQSPYGITTPQWANRIAGVHATYEKTNTVEWYNYFIKSLLKDMLKIINTLTSTDFDEIQVHTT